MPIKNNSLTIVSRKSRLALTQAEIVQKKLQTLHPDLNIEIIGISTRGDEILDQSLNKIGGKGLFVKELENCLLNGEADIAVHSMKDVPAELPQGLDLGAILMRADPRDVLLHLQHLSLAQLPQGAVVGTSSLRRQAQILAIRQDLKIAELRGNVETRVKKLIDGDYTAIVLAAAGLERLALNQWLSQPLAITSMLPAVGQGVLGIEYRVDDLRIKQLIAPLNHQLSASCLQAERAMNETLNGGCQAPVAGLALIENNVLTLRGLVGSPDGQIIYRAQHAGDPVDAKVIGVQVGAELIAQGADKIIRELTLKY